MSPLSLITKLQTVFDFITSRNLYLMILVVLVFLTIIFITTDGSNRKQSKKTYIILYLAFFAFIGIQYGESIVTVLDYAVNEIFYTYYFPNIVIYLIMLIVTNVILWKTIFSEKNDKKLKIINSCAFSIIVYLFILGISAINNLNLDIFNITELYSSNQVRSILELSMLIFTFWIVLLVIYHLIKKFQYKHNIIKTEEFTNYNIINDFNIDKAYKVPKTRIYIEEEKKEEPKIEKPSLEPGFTLEEYKVISKILKEEQEQKRKEETEDNNPLTELNKLYQSIRD